MVNAVPRGGWEIPETHNKGVKTTEGMGCAAGLAVTSHSDLGLNLGSHSGSLTLPSCMTSLNLTFLICKMGEAPHCGVVVCIKGTWPRAGQPHGYGILVSMLTRGRWRGIELSLALNLG